MVSPLRLVIVSGSVEGFSLLKSIVYAPSGSPQQRPWRSVIREIFHPSAVCSQRISSSLFLTVNSSEDVQAVDSNRTNAENILKCGFMASVSDSKLYNLFDKDTHQGLVFSGFGIFRPEAD